MYDVIHIRNEAVHIRNACVHNTNDGKYFAFLIGTTAFLL